MASTTPIIKFHVNGIDYWNRMNGEVRDRDGRLVTGGCPNLETARYKLENRRG